MHTDSQKDHQGTYTNIHAQTHVHRYTHAQMEHTGAKGLGDIR